MIEIKFDMDLDGLAQQISTKISKYVAKEIERVQREISFAKQRIESQAKARAAALSKAASRVYKKIGKFIS